MAGAIASPYANSAWYSTVKEVFRDVPESIWGSIVGVESQGNPNAEGDYQNGVPKSFGLFQIYTAGGLGDKYQNNPDALLNPETNARIAYDSIKPAYEAGLKRGLSGFQLAEYVSANAGFPTMAGTLPESYWLKLFNQYSRYTIEPQPRLIRDTEPAPRLIRDSAPNTSGLLSALGSLSKIESQELSILKPAESTKKIAIMISLAFLGLIMLAVGLVAFVGFGKAATIISPGLAAMADVVKKTEG